MLGVGFGRGLEGTREEFGRLQAEWRFRCPQNINKDQGSQNPGL